MSELADWLTRVERDQTHPNQRPKDAATIILIDRSQPVLQVLLGRRHQSHKFLPGKFVFPGGRVEPQDREVMVASPLDPQVEVHLLRRLKRPSPAAARAFAVAAIRELYEETGLLLGKPHDPTGNIWTAEALQGAFAEGRIKPHLSDLHFIARAITPPRRPRRFDTRFFAADAQSIVHRLEGVISPEAELVELVWLPIAQARELDVSTITKVVLIELETRIANGFGHALPVPFYRMMHRRFVRETL